MISSAKKARVRGVKDMTGAFPTDLFFGLLNV